MRVWADQLMIYDKDETAFPRLAKKFEEESPGRNFSEEAYSARDISLILNRYCNLKQINFYTHGNIGYMHLAGGGVTTGTAAHFLAAPHSPHASLFNGTGRVLFLGCNIGEGQQGRDFLIAAGQSLLNGCGGFVGGTTSLNIFGRWGIIDMRMPKWGDLRVLQLDARGQVLTEKLF